VPKLFTIIFITLLTCTGLSAVAQKGLGKISGVVVSDSARLPLSNATVTLLHPLDSTVEKMVVTDNKGRFTVEEVPMSSYLLLVTEINHDAFTRKLSLSTSNPMVRMDTLQLMVRSNQMEEIVVTRQKIPVVFKTDTIEFDASSFKVKENAVVEDLLKKLPGMEVARDGSVTAQGERITQIYVDGKPFFGSDPRMATQNLPADIIDKIQLVDKKSEQSRVTRVEDGVVEKVINITIKKNRNKGKFGRAFLGYGTNDRFEGRIVANQFNGTQKISLVAGSNNTGRSDNGDGGRNEEGGQNSNGINRDEQVRLSFSDDFGKKLGVHGNFGYSRNRNEIDQVRQRQTIWGDSANHYFEHSSSERSRSGFSGMVQLEYKPDTLIRINLHQSVQMNRNRNEALSSFRTDAGGTRKINEGGRENINITRNPSLNGNVSISRSFHKKGRGLMFNLSHNSYDNQSDGYLISSNSFFPLTGPDYERVLNQFLNTSSTSQSLSTSASYSEPLHKKGSLSLSLTHNVNRNNNIREAFDFNNLSNIYDLLNDSLSNGFDNTSYNSSAGLTYNYFLGNGTISVGSTWQNNRTKSRSLTNDSTYGQSVRGFMPHASFNMNKNSKRVNASYNYSARPPQAYQLQPIIDNTNPLYIRKGNPSLTFSSIHRFSASFNSFNRKGGMSLNANGNMNMVVNNISNSTSIDTATGVQTTMPVNLGGVHNGFFRVHGTRPVKLFGLKNSFSGSVSVNFNRNVSLLNQKENVNNSVNRRFQTGFNLEIKEWAEIRVNYNYGVQTTSYSLRPEQNNRTVANGAEISLELMPGKYSELYMEWDYSSNKGSAAGFNRQANLVNVSMTQYLDKKKSFWLRFRVYDLLKQNVSVIRFSGESFLEDVQTNILTRYFLVSMNWRMNRFGGKRPG
jgi:hypothetical protein